MSSSVGLIAPMILPMTASEGGYASLPGQAAVDVPGDPGGGVTITVPPGEVQAVVIPFETLLAPVRAAASFIPAGTTLSRDDGHTLGPFPADAWALIPQPDTTRPLFPGTVPEPGLYLLQGVSRVSVEQPKTGVLDQWLTNGVPGVQPQVSAAGKVATPSEQGGTPGQTWRNCMLAGIFAEDVPAGTQLGLADLADDGNPTLTFRVFDYAWTEIPASAVLQTMGTLNPDAMADHPVVTQASVLAADLPVQMFLRFDTWNPLGTHGTDPKGEELALPPLDVRLIDEQGGTIAGSTWTPAGDSGVLEINRSLVWTQTFSLVATFPKGTQLALERGASRWWPAKATDQLTWSTADWTARDTTTSGTWTDFAGIRVGSAAAPVAFWVGTKVRMALGYQEQHRPFNGGKNSAAKTVSSRRLTVGHAVTLSQASPSGPPVADSFTTDTEGEVSGVSFTVQPGLDLTIAVERRLAFGGTVIRVEDDPAATTPLYSDPSFHFEKATPPVSFPAFAAAAIDGAGKPLKLLIDADARDDTKANTPDAAAFHALKFARYTDDGIALLSGVRPGSATREHLFHAMVSQDANDGAGSATYDDPSTNKVVTWTHLPDQDWFTRRTVIHEYGHGVVRWLSNTVRDPVRRADAEAAVGAIAARLISERNTKGPGYAHSEPMVTNAGIALVEGLTLCFETFFGVGGTLFADKVSAGAKSSWAKYKYGVYLPVPPNPVVSLSTYCGRQVEGVFAFALFEHISKATGFAGFVLGTTGDGPDGCKQPQAFINAWQKKAHAGALDQLNRLIRWLLVDPITVVMGDKTQWTGQWPATGQSVKYPAVYDHLKRVFDQNPANPQTPQESFTALHNDTLVKWNLEQDLSNEPNPPVLGQDWTP
ncbi:MAG TPA: hypothetical protein VMT69_11635 [Kineosporiaceae bacterium]|nr:hypothetical protein [Kineosporiaceae bacterium]